MQKRILIAEDSATILEIIRQTVEAGGYAALTAVDGQETLEKARKEAPDLIILDLMLPKLDGYKVCRFLKFDAKYKKIPIIILTARAQESDKQLSQEVGADAYLNKPFDPEKLLAKIAEFIGA